MKSLPAVPLLLLLALVPAAGLAADDGFTVCPAEEGTAGRFADCTRAQCPWDGKSDVMDCPCTVREDVPSLTAAECQPGSDTALQSRYPGVASMGVCESATNHWADCLGVVCGPDDDGSTTCSCKPTTSEAASAKGYVVVGVPEPGAAAACASDVYYSSATPASVFEASSALGSGEPKISWTYP